MTRILRGIIQSVESLRGKVFRAVIGGLPDETIDRVELFGQYGFLSNPRAGAECIAYRNKSHYIIIATADRRYTIELAAGDVAIHTGPNEYVKLLGTGGIELKSTSVTIDSDDVKIGGKTGLNALVDSRILSALNLHIHAVAGATTGPVSGVAGELPPETPAVFNALQHATTNTEAK